MMICAASVAKIITNIVDWRFHNGRTTVRSSNTPNIETSAIASMAAMGKGMATSTIRRVGFLLPGVARTTAARGLLEAFREGLKEYGFSFLSVRMATCKVGATPNAGMSQVGNFAKLAR